MFSEELKILDRNTVKYMIDELQEELDDTKTQLTDAKTQLTAAQKQLSDASSQLSDKDATIAELSTEKTAFMQLINQLDEPNADKEAILSKLREFKK